MPKIDACLQEYNPLSESLSMIYRKKFSFIKEKCIFAYIGLQAVNSTAQVIDTEHASVLHIGYSHVVGCLNIFGQNLDWFTIFYIDRSLIKPVKIKPNEKKMKLNGQFWGVTLRTNLRTFKKNGIGLLRSEFIHQPSRSRHSFRQKKKQTRNAFL